MPNLVEGVSYDPRIWVLLTDREIGIYFGLLSRARPPGRIPRDPNILRPMCFPLKDYSAAEIESTITKHLACNPPILVEKSDSYEKWLEYVDYEKCNRNMSIFKMRRSREGVTNVTNVTYEGNMKGSRREVKKKKKEEKNNASSIPDADCIGCEFEPWKDDKAPKVYRLATYIYHEWGGSAKDAAWKMKGSKTRGRFLKCAKEILLIAGDDLINAGQCVVDCAERYRKKGFTTWWPENIVRDAQEWVRNHEKSKASI